MSYTKEIKNCKNTKVGGKTHNKIIPKILSKCQCLIDAGDGTQQWRFCGGT